MSLSRPARFPLLKLPWLCIKCVLDNLDEFILIYFATISIRTRRIVKSSNYPLKEIDVVLNRCRKIGINKQLRKAKDEKSWYFIHDKNPFGSKFLLKISSQPLLTSRHFDTWRGHNLHSYTAADTLEALKIGIDFMIDVFGCTIRRVFVDGDKLSELFGLGISTAKILFINDPGPVNITDLKYLLETIKVTDRYAFCAPMPVNFPCDPQIFKCQELVFFLDSAAWVTREILLQFEVPRLKFDECPFSVEDIVSFVTNWFHSDNKRLEYLCIESCGQISSESFQTEELNSVPFSGRTRIPLTESFRNINFSKGLEIIRRDGLAATIHVTGRYFLFYIWHDQSAITQN